MATLDVLVLSSRSEACPVVVLEAMALGLPVVAFDVGGVREQLRPDDSRPGGIICPPGDVAALAQGVLAILHDDMLAKKLGAAAKEIVEETFSLDSVAARHLEMYEQTQRRASDAGHAQRPKVLP